MHLIEYGEEPEIARELAGEALALMEKHGLSPNPLNFAIWYFYLSQRIPALNQELDRTISSRGTCTLDRSRELYRAYLANTDELDLAARTQVEVLALTESLLEQSSSAVDAAESYGTLLEDSSKALSSNISGDQLARLLEPLRDQTRAVGDLNLRYQVFLKKADADIRALQDEVERTRHEAHTDPLTNLYNRRALAQELDDRTSYFNEDEPVCMLMLDIDHFKQINDKHGHLMGDQVLAQTARIIQKCIDKDGYAARYGGEEFVVIVRDCPIRKAQKIAETVRATISRLKITHRTSGNVLNKVTISIGITQLTADDDQESFFDRADSALYQAKDEGRNRVIVVTA